MSHPSQRPSSLGPVSKLGGPCRTSGLSSAPDHPGSPPAALPTTLASSASVRLLIHQQTTRQLLLLVYPRQVWESVILRSLASPTLQYIHSLLMSEGAGIAHGLTSEVPTSGLAHCCLSRPKFLLYFVKCLSVAGWAFLHTLLRAIKVTELKV